jgi:hypothetical protein
LKYTQLVYRINESILDRKYWVMYLQPVPEGLAQIKELVQNKLDKGFVTVVKQHLKAYMVDGKEPPAAIAPTIKNFADDLVAGRSMTVRSGDYYAIQNFIQAKRATAR